MRVVKPSMIALMSACDKFEFAAIFDDDVAEEDSGRPDGDGDFEATV